MMAAIDQWLLIRVYQRMVNAMGVSRSALMEICAIGFLLFRILNIFVMNGEWPVLAKVFSGLCTFLLAALLFAISRSPAFQEATVGGFLGGLVRALCLLLVAFDLSALVFVVWHDAPSSVIAKFLSSTAASVLMTSVYYIAACQDPPPPRKRHSLIPGMG